MGELAEMYEYVKYLSNLPMRKAMARRQPTKEGEMIPGNFLQDNDFMNPNPTKEGKVMDFGRAIDAMKEGLKVCRTGWNGKGMFIFLNPGSYVRVSEGRPLASAYPVGTEIRMLPYIMMKTAGSTIPEEDPIPKLVPWLASQTDILADDWEVVK